MNQHFDETNPHFDAMNIHFDATNLHFDERHLWRNSTSFKQAMRTNILKNNSKIDMIRRTRPSLRVAPDLLLRKDIGHECSQSNRCRKA